MYLTLKSHSSEYLVLLLNYFYISEELVNILDPRKIDPFYKPWFDLPFQDQKLAESVSFWTQIINIICQFLGPQILVPKLIGWGAWAKISENHFSCLKEIICMCTWLKVSFLKLKVQTDLEKMIIDRVFDFAICYFLNYYSLRNLNN